MPEVKINVLREAADNRQLSEEMAKLQKLLRYLLNGMIDFENIRARSIKAENIEVGTLTAEEIAANAITTEKLDAGAVTTDKLKAGAVTADKISVAELSAITANLGHITAGLIEAVQIFGSYIATRNGTFPRVELSDVDNLLVALTNEDSYVALSPSSSGAPAYLIHDGGITRFILQYLSGAVALLATTGMQINANGGDLRLSASGDVTVPSWSKFVNFATGRTLQQDLNEKLDTTGVSDSFETVDGKTVTVINGAVVNIS